MREIELTEELHARELAAVRSERGALDNANFPAAEFPEHFGSDKCGFDRSGSHSAGTYVCTCGWPFEQSGERNEP